MIIKARHHWFYYPFFKVYSRWMPSKDFKEVRIHSDLSDKGLPLMMLGNHFSWWDGFIAQHINIRLFGRKMHIMMLEEQLEKRMFLNKTGAFSIKKGARSAIESINYSAEILKNPENLLVLFPQGKIHSMNDHHPVFEKGWYKIFRNLNAPIQVIFVICLVDYFSSRKPYLDIYLYDYPYEGKSLEDMNRDFNTRLADSINYQKTLA